MQQHNRNGVNSKIRAKPSKKGPINIPSSVVFEDRSEVAEPVSPEIRCLVTEFLNKEIGTRQY